MNIQCGTPAAAASCPDSCAAQVGIAHRFAEHPMCGSPGASQIERARGVVKAAEFA